MRPTPFQNGDWVSVRDCFVFASSGLESKRDHVVYGITRHNLEQKIREILTLEGPGQGSLFGPGEDRLQAPRRSAVPDPEMVRLRLQALLEKARAAEKMPWSERDARMWQTVFPNMAKWLPDREADQLRFEFAQEMERLRLAA